MSQPSSVWPPRLAHVRFCRRGHATTQLPHTTLEVRRGRLQTVCPRHQGPVSCRFGRHQRLSVRAHQRRSFTAVIGPFFWKLGSSLKFSPTFRLPVFGFAFQCRYPPLSVVVLGFLMKVAGCSMAHPWPCVAQVCAAMKVSSPNVIQCMQNRARAHAPVPVRVDATWATRCGLHIAKKMPLEPSRTLRIFHSSPPLVLYRVTWPASVSSSSPMTSVCVGAVTRLFVTYYIYS